uniref:Uncharacterized protein n=1 Tax=Spironucleus salmonicida TaxID=348837 RepID=V6LGN5_9EUKA|eukprot:EST42866.1 Hypothetical protein SS50377_ee040 [Spironucleus salmonicida]
MPSTMIEFTFLELLTAVETYFPSFFAHQKKHSMQPTNLVCISSNFSAHSQYSSSTPSGRIVIVHDLHLVCTRFKEQTIFAFIPYPHII